MAFSSGDVSAMIATAPSGAFNKANADQIRDWVDFVLNVEPNAAEKHDLFYYVSVARLLAETIGSTSLSDFEDPLMREMIKAAIVVNDLPCAAEQDPAWKAWKVSPAQVVFALKVQTKCAQAAPPARMAEAVKQLAELQTQALQKGKPKRLSFKLQDRIVEVGLQNFDKDTLPSEEILAKFEAGAKIANDKGRAWIGSAEGEDLRDHHRPAWSRTPLVDAVVGDGSYEDRVRQSAAAKRGSAWIDKIDYVSFATFMGHLHEWGFKVILTKACSMADFFSYVHIMIRIAEENGGVRTAFQYDVLQRGAMAKALERDETDLSRYLTRIDVDLLRTAKDKVDKRFAELARASGAPKGQSKGQPKGASKSYGDGGGHAASSASSGGKGGKSAKGDNRRVRSPPARHKGSAGQPSDVNSVFARVLQGVAGVNMVDISGLCEALENGGFQHLSDLGGLEANELVDLVPAFSGQNVALVKAFLAQCQRQADRELAAAACRQATLTEAASSSSGAGAEAQTRVASQSDPREAANDEQGPVKKSNVHVAMFLAEITSISTLCGSSSLPGRLANAVEAGAPRGFALCHAVEKRESLSGRKGREQFDLRLLRQREEFQGTRWEEALARLAEVADPDPFVRTAALDACCKAWKLPQARALFEEMGTKTVVAYTTLLALLGRLRRIQEAEQLFEELKQSGLRPDAATFTALMVGYGSVHDSSAAARVLEDIEAAGFRLGQVEFGVALRACGKAGDKELAGELLARMDAQRVELNVGHVTSAVVSCARSKDHATAIDFFDQLRRRGMVPDNIAYTSLATCHEGPDAAQRLEALAGEMRQASVQPDAFFYDQLLRVALADADAARFCSHLAELDAAGLRRTSTTAGYVQEYRERLLPAGAPLPPGWLQAEDPATGRSYFWHEADPGGTTTWERPAPELEPHARA
ncbi:unnamed protein product [Prorocentrum cordatum]|uniref:WW domain-containing protein n=1 Tax=Prorocentrum cordatum TaxID=2364126 RepID=A0ABN9WH69_9DINO|nr:unnamed protein product [Polarella glacialis]